MEIIVNESIRVVEIWLDRQEQADAALRASLVPLVPLYARYRAEKYKVTLFESGKGDLFEGTRALLLRNREAGR